MLDPDRYDELLEMSETGSDPLLHIDAVQSALGEVLEEYRELMITCAGAVSGEKNEEHEMRELVYQWDEAGQL